MFVIPEVVKPGSFHPKLKTQTITHCKKFIIIQFSNIIIYLYTSTKRFSVNFDFKCNFKCPD